MQEIKIFTDGGCSGNPGPGGWAYVMIIDGTDKPVSGGNPDTTNNRMELTAVISALKDALSWPAWKERPLEVYTDSQYVKNGITQWIQGWMRNGWKTAAKKPVKNQDLWRELHGLTENLKVEWHWVKGHAGNEYNERCDAMVRQEMNRFLDSAPRAAVPGQLF